MDFERLVARVRAILVSPGTEWPVIAAEQTTVADLYKGYVIPIAVLPAVAGFVKSSLIGVHVPYLGTLRVGIVSGFAQMILQYALGLGLVYVLAVVVDALAPRFGGEKDRIQALKLVAYSWTGAAVAGVAQILPGIGWLIGFAGAVYSIYLLYLGLPHLMKSPRERVTTYTAATVAAAFVVGIALAIVMAAVGVAGGPGATAGRDDVEIDEDSPLGKLDSWTKSMEKAGRAMEEAEESGDPEAQKEAFGQMMGSLLGSGEKVEALSPERLKTFVPKELAGLGRTELSAERNAGMGVQISEVTATYSDGAERTLRLEIRDAGSLQGLMALAEWANHEQEKETETGYERTFKEKGRTIHEKWDRSRGYGEYAILVGGRFSVEVSGEADSLDTLRDAAESIDLAGLESAGSTPTG